MNDEYGAYIKKRGTANGLRRKSFKGAESPAKDSRRLCLTRLSRGPLRLCSGQAFDSFSWLLTSDSMTDLGVSGRNVLARLVLFLTRRQVLPVLPIPVHPSPD